MGLYIDKSLYRGGELKTVDQGSHPKVMKGGPYGFRIN